MKIAICEDNELMLSILEEKTTEFFIDNHIYLQINPFKSAEAFLFDYEDNPDYDILLLDIQMNKMNGIELATKLRDNGNKSQIIFTTSIRDYVFEGYSVQAVDYLLKPIDSSKLHSALKRCIENMNYKEKELLLNIHGDLLKIKEKDIYYIESEGRNTCVYTESDKISVNKPISSYDEILDDTPFFQCHRSFIINLAHISAIRKADVELENNKLIPIARGKYKELNDKFLHLYGRIENEPFS